MDFELKEGYERLCPFLGADVPMEKAGGKGVKRDFPKVNEGKEFGARKKVAVKLAMKRVMRKFVFSGLDIGTAVLVWKYWQVMRSMVR